MGLKNTVIKRRHRPAAILRLTVTALVTPAVANPLNITWSMRRLSRTILLLHIISVSPSKQPLMVRTFLKVYMELGSYFLFLQEQIKDIIII